MTYAKSINHSQALKLVASAAESMVKNTECIAIANAINRVVDKDVIAPVDVPSFDCSQMDGYALNLHQVHTSDNQISKKGATTAVELEIGSPIHARKQADNIYCKNTAVPIMTGGVLPIDATAVIAKEKTSVKNDRLLIAEIPQHAQYIRKVGTDLKKGQVVIKANSKLSAASLGLLTSLGLVEVEVLQQPHVALMMTGDELVPAGQACLPGEIFDSNAVMLVQLLKQMGCLVTLLETLKDNESAVNERLKLLNKKNFDLVISVGGVSMGEKDFLPQCLSDHGKIIFHKVKVKPGFPMLFGRLNKSIFYGLPGNPVSAYTMLCQYVYPVIKALQNQVPHSTQWQATLSHDIHKRHSRREFMRGVYDVNEGGMIEVLACTGQQSSRIGSLTQANCFMVINESQHELKAGAKIQVQPFTQYTS